MYEALGAMDHHRLARSLVGQELGKRTDLCLNGETLQRPSLNLLIIPEEAKVMTGILILINRP